VIFTLGYTLLKAAICSFAKSKFAQIVTSPDGALLT